MNQREKLIYLAGILDGEGSIVIWSNKASNNTRGKYNLRIYISNTYKPLIDWIKENFGGHIYKVSAPSRKPKWKTAYNWVLDRPNTLSFLNQIYPFLMVKKEKCEIAIKFRKTFEKRYKIVPQEILNLRQQYVDQIKHLSSRCY